MLPAGPAARPSSSQQPEPDADRPQHPPSSASARSSNRSPHVTSSSSSPPEPPPSSRPCKFFASPKGCRAGTACPFRHVDHASSLSSGPIAAAEPTVAYRSSRRNGRGHASPAAAAPRRAGADVASKPTRPPQRYTEPANAAVERPLGHIEAQDPRAFQISQIKRRYGAIDDGDGTVLRFALAPSDPDFPFELDRLQCALRLPPGFPQREAPSLAVSNAEIDRGFRVNVERGFAVIWAELRSKTLLNALKLLDRRLESLLTAEKADTITLIANKGPSPPQQSTTPKPAPPAPAPAQAKTPASRRPRSPPPSFERLEQARSKRATETRQLEHRMGRESSFRKEGDGTIFTLPIEPRKRPDLPAELKSVRTLRLFVPESYDIAPCSIELIGVEGSPCENVEAAFARRAKDRRDLTLLAHVNYLSQNMHLMATEKREEDTTAETVVQQEVVAEVSTTEESHDSGTDIQDTDKIHVKVIPRPPEWSQEHSSASDSSDYDTSDEGNTSGLEASSSGSEDADGQAAPLQARESGVMLSLPGLQMSNVELLEISLLSLTVKCTRCKEPTDIHGIKPNDESNTLSSARSQTCRKCSLDLTVSFRRDLMHHASARAGYLDLDNCEPLDLLSSNFLPTCAKCSTTYPHPGIVAARVASDSLAICRACHARMLFVLPQVHFLRVGPSASLPRRSKKRTGGGGGTKDERARLGIVPGTELPRRGTCEHYRKSFRWFRFGCCEKLYACDRCHDAAETAHPQELANRMVCGFCSREQPFHPEACKFCRRELTGRTGRGFWEGGKGTRDPARMSRKDPRKFKLARKVRGDREKARERNER